MKRFSAVTLAVALFLVAGTGFCAPDVGEPAVDFTLEEADGAMITLSDYIGKVGLLTFWNSF